MATRLSELKAAEVSIVPRGANKQTFLIVKEDVGMDKALEKVLKDAGLDAATIEKVGKGLVPVFKEATEKAAADAKAEAEAKAKEEAEKKDKESAVSKQVPVQKADGTWDFSHIPEAARPSVEAVWKEKIAKDAELADIRKSLKEERDARVNKEFVEKAGAYKHLGIAADKLGPVLKSLSESAPEAFKELETVLKGADERLGKGGLFTEVGSNSPGGTSVAKGDQTEAEAKAEAIAKGLVEKDGTMSLLQAKQKVWKMHPELYSQHRQEMDARRKRA